MFKNTRAFSSFSVNDLEKAKDFYGRTLGLEIVEIPEGLDMHLAGTRVFVYPTEDDEPPAHTVLNFAVDDIDAAIDALAERGVRMEQYDLPEIKTDRRGVFRGETGPKAIAWFKDPFGHVLSVLQEE